MVLWFVLLLLAEGLIVGALARPERDPLGVPGTLSLALAGSYLGGVMAWLFINRGVGLVFGLIGATALIYTRRRFVAYR